MISRRTVMFITIGLFLCSSGITGKIFDHPEALKMEASLKNMKGAVVKFGTKTLEQLQDAVIYVISGIGQITAMPIESGRRYLGAMNDALYALFRNAETYIRHRTTYIRTILRNYPVPSEQGAADIVKMLDEIMNALYSVTIPIVATVRPQDFIYQNVAAVYLQSIASLMVDISHLFCEILRYPNVPETLVTAVRLHQTNLGQLLETFIFPDCQTPACVSLSTFVDRYSTRLATCPGRT